MAEGSEEHESERVSLKMCPDCAEEVKAAARVCRYCGYRFDPTEPRPGVPTDALGEEDAIAVDPEELAAEEPAALLKSAGSSDLVTLEEEIKDLARAKLTGDVVAGHRKDVQERVAGKLAQVLTNELEPGEKLETMALLSPRIGTHCLFLASTKRAWLIAEAVHQLDTSDLVAVSGKGGRVFGKLSLTDSEGTVRFRVGPKDRVDEICAWLQARLGSPS